VGLEAPTKTLVNGIGRLPIKQLARFGDICLQ